jgi:hypothetical protein
VLFRSKLINRTDERTNTKVLGGILRINQDGSDLAIPLAPDNTDYQEYLKWVAEGNTPLPADE